MSSVFVARRSVLTVLLSVVAILLPLAAAETPVHTTNVTVSKLCPTCGKNIIQKFEKMPQVASALMNLEQQLIQVKTKPGQVLSPRLAWETVEEGGEQPVKLQGPSGTFTAKPPQ